MQNVSQEWKDNQTELLTPESFVEISLTLTDPDAYEDATAEDNGHIYISNTEQTVSEVDKDIIPYVTLEQNLWMLNDSRKIIPTSNYGDCGYISNVLSGGNCIFVNKPTVTINFLSTNVNLIPGVTITWGIAYDEYAVDFTVTAYNGDTVIARQDIVGNTSVMSTVPMDIVDYDRIVISISKWSLPYRRARVAELLPGITKIYTKTDLFSFEHSQQVDPISASLPKSEISFSIDNTDNSYNPNNVDSLAKYLIERQEVKTKYGYKIGNKVEWLDCGTFYMSEWDAPQGGMTADFKARDLLEFMTGTYYYGTYSPNGVSLYDLALSVLQDAELPLEDEGIVKWVIDDSLKNIYTVAPLPIDTHANCLQLIANAGGCVIYQDRKGILHIKPFVRVESDYTITHFNSYSKSEISLSKPLKQVDVSCYSYSVSADNTELYKGTMNISGTQELLISYSGTATNVSATISGGTLVTATYYSNACVLKITASGDVTITVTGKSLVSSNVKVITSSGVTGETISVDNPLITSQSRAVTVGKWVESYMKNRMTLSSDWRADPRLDALDIVDNENDYNTNKVLMTEVKYSYNGAFKGSGEGRVI
jgi:hypothetical protein